MAIHEAPFPSSTELLEKDGGFYFERPSDGKLLEYYDINQSGSTLVLVIHGSSSTGRLFTEYEEFAQQNSLRLVSPSIPGFGASQAYAKMEDIKYVLETFSKDVLSLLDHLKVEQFFVLGLSMGSEFAFVTGSNAAKEGRLLGISSTVGVVFPQEKFEGFVDKSPPYLRVLANIMSNQYVGWPIFQALARPFMGERSAPMMPPEVPEDRATFLLKEIERSHRYTLSGALYATTYWTLRVQHPETYADYEAITENIPVQLYYGTKDSMVDFDNQQYLLDKIKHAVAIPFEGDHVEANCGEALGHLLHLL